MTDLMINGSLFTISFLSGMLGIGIAFAAVPLLAASGLGLVSGVQPIALFLNGITALFAALSFGVLGLIEWRRTIQLAIVTSVFTPLGALAAAWMFEYQIWIVYFSSLGIALFFLLGRSQQIGGESSFPSILLVAVPISTVSGLLGVGPGFLLVPYMIFTGLNPRSTAAMNAVAAAPASFLSLIPHGEHFAVHASMLPVIAIAAGGAFLGARYCGLHIPEQALRRLFVTVVLGMSLYRGVSLPEAQFQYAVDFESEFMNQSLPTEI